MSEAYFVLFSLHKFNNCIGGVMVSMLELTMVDRVFELLSDQTKDYLINICCFSTKQTTLKKMIKDWLAQNQNNVSKWSGMSTRRLLFQ
jgi:hypothetical protein